jgi:hypothetical protein
VLPGALVDIIITDYDGVDPTDADNALLRAKYIRFLQHIYNYVWNVREWEWTYKESALSMAAAANSVALPTDFQSIGSHGSLYQGTLRFTPRPRYYVERLRGEGGLQSTVFSVWGSKVQIPYTVSAITAFTLFHRFMPETMVDGPAEEPPAPPTDMLIPERYVHTVLLPGLIFRSQEKKQDARKTWSDQFNAGLTQMASEENPGKFESARMPLAVRGGW